MDVVTSAALIAALSLSTGALAQFDLGDQQRARESADQYAKVQVLADREAIGPGEQFNIVILFDIVPTWHIYWKNPGVGALAPNVRVRGPEGFTIGEARWPRPKAIDSPIGEMYCHEGRAAIFIPVTAPESLSDGSVTFSSDIGYAVCDHRKCLFGQTTLSTAIKTTASTNHSSIDESSAKFKTYHGHLPSLIGDVEGASARLIREGDQARLIIHAPDRGFHGAVFFSLNSPGVTYDEPEWTFADGKVKVVIPLYIDPQDFTSGPPLVGGLIGLGEKTDDPSYEFSLPLHQPSDR